MTWDEIRVDDLMDWIGNLSNPDIDPVWIREWYGVGNMPEIMFENLATNAWTVYIAENSWDSSDKQYPLLPWRSITMDFSTYVRAKNIFYVTWAIGDSLAIIVR